MALANSKRSHQYLRMLRNVQEWLNRTDHLEDKYILLRMEKLLLELVKRHGQGTGHPTVEEVMDSDPGVARRPRNARRPRGESQ